MEIQFQVQPTTAPYVGGGSVEFRSPPCPLNFILSSTVMRRSIWISGRTTYDDATTVRSQIVARERGEWTEAAVAEQLAAMGVPEHRELIQDTLAAVGTAVPGMVIDVIVLDWAEVLVDDYEDAIDIVTRESFETAAYRANLVPASKSVIDGLEKVGTADRSELQTEQCSICMEDLVDLIEKEHITRLPCLHHFHTDCIAHWLGINHKCPLCRIPVEERGNS